MNRNQLKLNDDKTEFLLIATKQLENVNFNSITIGNTLIEAKPEVRNLGSWFDSHLDTSTHISKLLPATENHQQSFSSTETAG